MLDSGEVCHHSTGQSSQCHASESRDKSGTSREQVQRGEAGSILAARPSIVDAAVCSCSSADYVEWWLSTARSRKRNTALKATLKGMEGGLQTVLGSDVASASSDRKLSRWGFVLFCKTEIAMTSIRRWVFIHRCRTSLRHHDRPSGPKSNGSESAVFPRAESGLIAVL
ncbi:hypothetical protein P280DRAFT_74667 [Massarina eburnea CBS 473.64]|uniref:Uncharacterized protein n=1 Tax=Massarina eburnea CBS 473.64 TaxID=1395130 RepID=A0A6A6RTS9_9PLEO|nr:hypothetical protein P280DRAFT_74667 [Massarina eburnea CBS 473.64]